MQKLLALIVGFFLSTTIMMAQTKTVTGQVLAEVDGEPIIGASVVVTNTSNGTITDFEGKFSVKVPENAKSLTVSYVGMETKTVNITGKSLTITLSENNAVLDDVVVVAYGTQRKTTLTGAIQSVKAEAIEARPTSSVTSALEGTVAGVQVNSTYGSPGSDPEIRIRGIGTVNGSSSPLYVLDGVAFSGNISDLNPSDIESISVLKDAASAALYGNRASNGVILIQTKKGKMGRLNVTFDVKQGTYNRGIPEYDRADAREWMEIEWQNLRNNRMSSVGEDAATAAAYASANLIDDIVYLNIFNKANDALFDANGKMVKDAQILPGYADDLDWFKEGLRAGFRQDYNLSANGANDMTDYRFSIGYLDENGYLKDSGFERISASAAINIKPRKWIKTGLNMTGSYQTFLNTNGGSDGSYTNAFMYARNIAPVYPVHLHDVTTGEYILDVNGNKQWDPGSYIDKDGNVITTRNQFVDRHVYYENELNYDKTARTTFNTIAFADIILPYGFTFTVKGNLNLRNSRNYTYNSAVIGDGKGSLGRAKRSEYSYKTYQFMQQLHWAKEYGKHSIDVLAGHENYSNEYNYLYAYKTNEIVPGWGNLTNFTQMTSLDSNDDKYRTESYLGRVRYGYAERYNVEASFRRDGSSRFAKESRWGNFWSVGANWNVTSEEFMKEYTWLNYLKLRADYGEVGNDAGAGYYASQALYNLNQNANQGAIYLAQFPNKDLKWETGQSWGVGIESRLFDRLNIDIEYFDKRNKDLLFDVYLPLSSGATSSSSAESVVTKNLGTISNRGMEVSADVDVFKSGDWKINVGANLTLLKNEIVKLPEQNKNGIIDGTKYIVEGKSRYEFYMYTYEGIDSNNGYTLYKFNDGDAQGNSYRFELGGKQYGDWSKDTEGNYNATLIKESAVESDIVIIGDTPYSYTTTYAKKEFHGSAIPKVYGSFNLNATWKQLTLSTLFTYQIGGKVYDGTYRSYMTPSSTPYAFHRDILKAWTVEDATTEHAIWDGDVPVVDYGLSPNLNTASSHYLTSANYLILKNINIGYQLPKSITKKWDIESLAINASCENAFTKTARKGMNPQQGFSGMQYNYLTTPRVFSVGLTVKFGGKAEK